MVKNVIDVNSDEIFVCLTHAQVSNMRDLLDIHEDQISSLDYVDENCETKILSLVEGNTLRLLRAWNTYLLETNGLSTADWMDSSIVSCTHFEQYRDIYREEAKTLGRFKHVDVDNGYKQKLFSFNNPKPRKGQGLIGADETDVSALAREFK